MSDEMRANGWAHKNIYGSNNELLIGIGTPITEKMLKHLDNRYWSVCKPKKYIYDNVEVLDEYIMPNIDGDDINLSRIIEKAKEIVDLIKQNPVVYQNLNKIKKHDEYTYHHSTQVAYLAVAMGIKFEFTTRDLINLSIASLLHDLGKSLINKQILNKPDKLTEDETKIMQEHPEIGYYLLKKCYEIDEDVLKMVLHHHENYDGTGYPHGLSRDEISIQSSIIHVCDVFNALVSERSYKKKYDVYKSMEIIRKNSGTMFNPKVVDVFSRSIQIYSIGSVVYLSDGSKAIINGFKRDVDGNVIELELLKQNKCKVYKKSVSN